MMQSKLGKSTIDLRSYTVLRRQKKYCFWRFSGHSHLWRGLVLVEAHSTVGRRGGDPNQHREKFVFNFSCPVLKCKLYFIRDVTGTCSSSEEGRVKLASLRKMMPEVHLYSLLKERVKLVKGQPGRTYSVRQKHPTGTSLMVQWLRLFSLNAGTLDSILVRELDAMCHN